MASIRKRGKNSWQIIVSCGYDINGQKLTETKTIKKPPDMTDKQWEKELKKIALEFERQVETGQYLSGAKMTIAEFAELWIKDYAEKYLEPKTVHYYKDMLYSRILPTMGHITLEKLQPMHLIEFYNNLGEEGIRRDTKYKARPELIETMKKESMAAFARKASVSDKTISNLCRNGNTTIDIVEKISKYLNEKPDNLFVPVEGKIKLTGNTILHYHRVISSMLTDAVQWQLIAANPAARVKPPKAEDKEANHYDEEQTAYLLEYLENEHIKIKTAIMLVIFTGMRLGEVAGLEWKDIDFKNKVIKVVRSSQYLNDKNKPKNKRINPKDPKTRAGKRDINIPDIMIKVLKQYKNWQNEERLKSGDLWIDSDRLFTKWNGAPIFPGTISGWFRKFREKYDLPPLTFHQLRHTNASLMIAQGVDVATVSKRLGHANISTTMNIYSHALRSPNKEAADKLEKLFVKKNTKAFVNN